MFYCGASVVIVAVVIVPISDLDYCPDLNLTFSFIFYGHLTTILLLHNARVAVGNPVSSTHRVVVPGTQDGHFTARLGSASFGVCKDVFVTVFLKQMTPVSVGAVV